jgi:tetratricopeptide (TPR) repeat protein
MARRVFALVLLTVVCLLAATAGAQSPAVDLAEHGHWKRLKALVEPRAAANPNDAEAQWLLSRARMAFKDMDGALAPAEKAAALDPKNVEYRWQVAQVVGEMASSASVFKQMGLAKRYRREVDAALALNPKHTPSLMGLMEYYYRAPGIVGGDKAKAEAIPDQLMAINKVDGHLAKARLLSRAEPPQPGQVEQVYVQAVLADPSRYEPHVNLANIYASGTAPRWDLAEKEALTAKRIDADRTAPYSILAAVYATSEKWTELDAILAEAEKKIPDNLTPYLRASGALLASGKDLSRAERCARKYLSQEPEPNASSPAVAHWRLGLILEKQGKKPEAIAELQSATKLDPKFEQALKDLKRLKAGS